MSNVTFFDGSFFDGDFFDGGSGGHHGGAGQHGRGKKGRRELPPIYRFLVELAGETHYFGSEAEARAFMQKQARTLYKRAHVVARSKIDIAEPAKRIALPAPQPIPRFVAQGNDAISLLTQRINARIDAILANPNRDADEDDADLADLMADDETQDDKDLKRILQ